MEFWGIEVKPGQTVKCDPGDEKYLHLSQASLGETKKDKTSENVPVFVKVNGQKLVIGTLSGDKWPQIQYDLVFETEFELSHSSKSTSIFFVGYRTLASEVDPQISDSDFDSEDEPIEIPPNANGKPEKEGKKDDAKLVSGQGEGFSKKSKVKVEEPKAAKPKLREEDDDDDDDDDSTEFDSDSDDEGMPDVMDDSDDDEDSSDKDEEDEATPKKAEISKKRAADSAPKTPVPEKKAKLVSPSGSQKTGGGKKSVHTATPYPSKQPAKTPANSDKSKPQTPKSGGSGSAVCKSCSKSFSSDHALQSHTKAKHETAK